jgi:hypothetical protein
MTREEVMSKNINLTFDFVDYLIKNPSEIDKIPNGCTVIFKDSIPNGYENKFNNENVLNVRRVYEFG